MFVAPDSAPRNLHERLTAIAQAGFDRAERKFDIMQQLGTNRALNDNSFHTRRRKRHSDSRRNVPDEKILLRTAQIPHDGDERAAFAIDPKGAI